MAKLVQDGPTYIPDNLIVSGNMPLLPTGVTIKQGTTAKRGAVIALEDVTQKGVLADKSKTSNIVFGILTDDVEAVDGDVVATVYRAGHFNEEVLTFAEGTTIKDYELELRKSGIYTDTVKEGN